MGIIVIIKAHASGLHQEKEKKKITLRTFFPANSNIKGFQKLETVDDKMSSIISLPDRPDPQKQVNCLGQLGNS